jgi:hypothetical protein
MSSAAINVLIELRFTLNNARLRAVAK